MTGFSGMSPSGVVALDVRLGDLSAEVQHLSAVIRTHAHHAPRSMANTALAALRSAGENARECSRTLRLRLHLLESPPIWWMLTDPWAPFALGDGEAGHGPTEDHGDVLGVPHEGLADHPATEAAELPAAEGSDPGPTRVPVPSQQAQESMGRASRIVTGADVTVALLDKSGHVAGPFGAVSLAVSLAAAVADGEMTAAEGAEVALGWGAGKAAGTALAQSTVPYLAVAAGFALAAGAAMYMREQSGRAHKTTTLQTAGGFRPSGTPQYGSRIYVAPSGPSPAGSQQGYTGPAIRTSSPKKRHRQDINH